MILSKYEFKIDNRVQVTCTIMYTIHLLVCAWAHACVSKAMSSCCYETAGLTRGGERETESEHLKHCVCTMTDTKNKQGYFNCRLKPGIFTAEPEHKSVTFCCNLTATWFCNPTTVARFLMMHSEIRETDEISR